MQVDRLPAGFFKRTAAANLQICVGRPRPQKGCKVGFKGPVSLTPVSCKILKRIICNGIMANAERQSLLSSMQFAYRRKKSTQDCLLVSTYFEANASNEEDSVDVDYTEFENAFETMVQDLILSLLPRKEVGVKIATWISEFLRGRNFLSGESGIALENGVHWVPSGDTSEQSPIPTFHGPDEVDRRRPSSFLHICQRSKIHDDCAHRRRSSTAPAYSA